VDSVSSALPVAIGIDRALRSAAEAILNLRRMPPPSDGLRISGCGVAEAEVPLVLHFKTQGAVNEALHSHPCLMVLIAAVRQSADFVHLSECSADDMIARSTAEKGQVEPLTSINVDLLRTRIGFKRQPRQAVHGKLSVSVLRESEALSPGPS
jgi:hypothetical protein